ncbi:MAG: hypothetical protein B7X12_08085 [Halothiobacillus sp. 20-53-49]|nr:MAG: hypothetical protein B7X12_08085 [Halothiobacillus sp. 20-53-49]OZB55478.1 MAG: hypothetical protein B7X35_08870 [Halothiobacillus sp. 14-56-357]
MVIIIDLRQNQNRQPRGAWSEGAKQPPERQRTGAKGALATEGLNSAPAELHLAPYQQRQEIPN